MEAEYDFEPEMILIPAGWFLMGSDRRKDRSAALWEEPQHKVRLPDYHLAKTPVTNAQYLVFVQATGHEAPQHWKGGKIPSGKQDHPVIHVSWYDAVAYCHWLAELTGKPYRLPGEGKWEKGARGTDGRRYPWGNRWNAKRCNSKESGPGDTTPVGKYPKGASSYGLLDMAGNVWEWMSSLYADYPYNPYDGRGDPELPGRRVVRGGSFECSRTSVRCAHRSGVEPHVRVYYPLGFRVAAAGTDFEW